MIRLVLCDVDGTLVPPFTDSVSVRVREAVRAIEQSSVVFGFATGRRLGSLRLIADQIGAPRAWAICSNGAVTARFSPDLPDGAEVTREAIFDPSAAARQLLDVVPGGIVAASCGDGYLVTRLFPPGELFGEKVATLDEVLAHPVTKVVMRWPDRTSDELLQLAGSMDLSDGVDVIVSKMAAWVDLVAAGVSKASAARQLAQDLGIDRSEVLAIGDDYNDIELLTWAGTGIAMRDSPSLVVEAANSVTASVIDDGAAIVLEKLVRRRALGSLFGTLPKPSAPVTLEDMDAGIARGAAATMGQQ